MSLLSLIVFLPLVGVAFLLLLRGPEEAVARNAYWMGLWVSSAVFLLSLSAWFAYDPALGGFQLVEERLWIPSLGIGYRLGVDGISLPFVVLSSLLTLLVILAGQATAKRSREYVMLFLVLETFMLGSFTALDLFLFYVFFEAVLIPMFVIIGVWGGPRRVYSAFKFFLYTLAGSILMLLGFLYIWSAAGSSSIPYLLENLALEPGVQRWLWLALFASFAVKVPMWPVHTWLPDAHVEAPTGGSVILAGVLLKLGGYGLIRFSLPMLPDASEFFAPLVFLLSGVAITYASLTALVQEDMKKMIAYSSVAHMGFVTAGLFTFTPQGVEGAVFQMISHGVISAALFLVVGVVYDRRHSRRIDDYGGLARTMPRYAAFFLLFTLGSVGLPGTSGFVGEFLVILGAFQASGLLAFFVSLGMVLGAVYMLSLYRRVSFGTSPNEEVSAMADLSPRELTVFAPLAVLTLLLGIWPGLVLDVTAASVALLLEDLSASGLSLAEAGR